MGLTVGAMLHGAAPLHAWRRCCREHSIHRDAASRGGAVAGGECTRLRHPSVWAGAATTCPCRPPVTTWHRALARGLCTGPHRYHRLAAAPATFVVIVSTRLLSARMSSTTRFSHPLKLLATHSRPVRRGRPGLCQSCKFLQECHARGAVLLVDEAHGAHLGLHPSFPPSAIHAGADVAVQSTHKTLGSLTQTAMLHIGPGAAPALAAAVARHLSVFQTTSPSYLLMCSLEAAAHAASDPATFTEPLRAAEHVRHAWHRCGGRTLCTQDLHATRTRTGAPSQDCHAGQAHSAYDPLRVTLLATGTGLSGFRLASALQRHKVVAEMATEGTIVLALGTGSTLRDACMAELAFRAVWADSVRATRAQPAPASGAATVPGIAPGEELWPGAARGVPGPVGAACSPLHAWRDGLTDRAVTPADCVRLDAPGLCTVLYDGMSAEAGCIGKATCRNREEGRVQMVGPLGGALAAEVEEVMESAAEGRRSGALVSVYPPGVPVLLYGQVIDAASLAALAAAVAGGARVTGCCSDGTKLLVLQEGTPTLGEA